MPDTVKVCLIAARGRNHVIGREGDLPWRLKDDLAFFKKTTLGCPIVMGRKTWESLPFRPLKGRENIVLTRDWTYAAPGARVYSSFAAAINTARAIAQRQGADKVFVIGGATIYDAAMSYADRIYMTEVDAAPEGDVRFPEVRPADWATTTLEAHEAGDGNDHAFTIVQMDRTPALT
ncbi:MAG: dihydrofolate reductase [Hyphomonas sp.]|uniref:dihydrofolate reductase n=1 Tax=Hyphomonas sp. TaxID=87 RepID=UPI003526F999